jgi:hypothetical protein
MNGTLRGDGRSKALVKPAAASAGPGKKKRSSVAKAKGGVEYDILVEESR